MDRNVITDIKHQNKKKKAENYLYLCEGFYQTV